MEKEKTVGKIKCWPIDKIKARRIETRADLSMICPAKTGEGDYIRTSTRHEKGESRIGRTALATFIDSVGRSRVVPGLASWHKCNAGGKLGRGKGLVGCSPSPIAAQPAATLAS